MLPLALLTAKQDFCHHFPMALQKHRSGRDVPSHMVCSEIQFKPGCVATSLASSVLNTADPSVTCHGIVPASLFALEVCFIVCC